MNNIVFMGGEYNLIDRLSISMILNCNLFMFNCMVIGKKIGVKIRMVGVIFKNVLMIISSKLISSKISNGLLLMVSNVLLSVCGMFLKESSYDIVVDVVMSSIMMVVVFVVFNMMSGNVFSVIFL